MKISGRPWFRFGATRGEESRDVGKGTPTSAEDSVELESQADDGFADSPQARLLANSSLHHPRMRQLARDHWQQTPDVSERTLARELFLKGAAEDQADIPGLHLLGSEALTEDLTDLDRGPLAEQVLHETTRASFRSDEEKVRWLEFALTQGHHQGAELAHRALAFLDQLPSKNWWYGADDISEVLRGHPETRESASWARSISPLVHRNTADKVHRYCLSHPKTSGGEGLLKMAAALIPELSEREQDRLSLACLRVAKNYWPDLSDELTRDSEGAARWALEQFSEKVGVVNSDGRDVKFEEDGIEIGDVWLLRDEPGGL